MKTPFIFLLSISLASCAMPKKALIIAEEPKLQPKQEIASASAPSRASLPAPANEGLRMPDMLTLPDEEQLRSAPSESPGEAAVIVRPPAE